MYLDQWTSVAQECKSVSCVTSGVEHPALPCAVGVGFRRGSDPEFLWLWHRPAATAPIRLLALEPPSVAGTALKRKKKKII